MNKNATYALVAVIVVLIAAGSFYGGMLYGKSKSGPSDRAFNSQMPAGMQAAQGARTGKNRQGQGFVNGEIISKDDKSMTVKLMDGGSKIIFLADSTQISKSASGTASDLINGKRVMVNGKSNTDGSITATYITLQPNQSNMPGGALGQNPVDQPAEQTQK